MAVCLCRSHLISVATPCLECVHASVHEFMSTLHHMSCPPPRDSYMKRWVTLCVTLSLSHSPWLWSHTLFRMCTCFSRWIYVHLATYVWSTPMHSWWKPECLYMAVCLCPSHLISFATPCLECVYASVHEFMSTLHPMSGPPLWKCIWKNGCPCVSLCLCPIHPGCGSTPCLECAHASVHEFMSTWLLMSGPAPMHSLMETWEPLYGSVFVLQSSHFWSDTLFRMCTCISTWIYVYLTPHVWSTPYE